ncbi:Hypothetical protein CINCED_3A001948 [Cinara cedri]|nr:Hypothetical protein CINCED_3A001948 [Cinara cedri]
MASNPPSRSSRGRARGRGGAPSENQSPPRPQTQGPRPQTQGPRPQTQGPRPQTQGPRPQTQGPRPQTQGLGQQVSRPQASRPQTTRQQAPITQTKQTTESSNIEEITQGVLNIRTAKDECHSEVSISRGAMHGRGMMNNDILLVKPEKARIKGKEGQFGNPVALLSNYFPISAYTDWVLYQYRVDFSPEEDRFIVRKGLLGAHQKRLGAYIFDGTMLFSSRKYEPKTFELTSKRYDDTMIKVTITFTTVLDPCHYAHIQVFNLILRNCLRSLNLQQIGRNFYDAKAQIKIPNHKITLWPGYETSIVLSDSGLLWRTEISTKVMREETVFDFFVECLNNSKRNPGWMETFKAGVIGQTVMTRYNNASYKIDDVDEKANTQSTFEKKDGSKMSYVDYYKQKWNITLKGGKQPMLVSKKQRALKSLDDKSSEDLIYLVPELCSMTGFTDEMRNNFTTMKAVSEYTRIGPRDRINRYYNFHKRMKSTPEAMESLKNWNLGLKEKLVEIKGRMLPPELIYTVNESYDGGFECDWSRKITTKPMFKTASLSRWVILYPERIDYREFVGSLMKVSYEMGMRLPNPDMILMHDTQIRYYSQILEQIINEKNPSFILCIVSSSRADIYNLIKKKLCVDRAVPSQVVLSKHVSIVKLSIVTKIVVQINCKLGGAPWKVAIPLAKHMILGFDVCHDKQKKNISYGALVATMNDSQTSFYSCVERHESGQELSAFFGATITKAMLKYKELNGCFPLGIIVYRDGVGDGQISHVYQSEVTAIKKTCNVLCKDNSPGLAFIIVKKRISTRFFINDRAGFRNPAPGTIIDTVVTYPTM